MSDAEKQKSHKRIVEAASRMLRQQGIEATSVSDVMQAAGLTHGGFYRHFASKEDLVAAAIEYAASSVLESAEAGRAQGDASAVEGYVADYLSETHRQNRQTGCPLAALAGEALRVDGPVRDAVQDAARRTACLLSGASDARGDTGEPDDLGLASVSMLVGALVLARLTQDTQLSQRFLDVGARTVKTLREKPDAGQAVASDP